MHIEKLFVKGFGKVSNLTLSLKKGLNIVYGTNESGKSTIQWFIRGMFFGLKGGRVSRDGVLPPLKRFTPWEGNGFGGLIEYRLDSGKSYRVERNFQEGSTRVFDSQLNDITDTFSTGRSRSIQFAEGQLGMDEMCFEKTVYIGQMESRINSSGRGDLLNRLVNISQTGFEDVSFQKAEKALKEAAKKYVGTEKTSTRPLDRVNERLDTLKEERNNLKIKRESLLSVEGDMIKASNEKRRLDSRKSLLSEVKKLIDIKRQVESIKTTLKNLKRYEGDKKNRKNHTFITFVAVSLLFVAAGFIISSEFFIGAAAGLLITVVIGVLKGKSSKKIYGTDCENKQSLALEAEISETSKKLCVMEQNLNISVERLKEKCEGEDEFGKWSNEELSNLISNLKTDLTEEDIGRMEMIWQYDYDKTESSVSKLALKIKECQILLQNLPDNEEIQKLEEEIEELEQKKVYLEELKYALDVAVEALTEAASEIQRDFVPRLNSSMGSIINKITGGRYTDLRTDDSLCIKTTLPETGNVGEAVNLSGGTIDQMYFALRVAAVELMEGKGEKLPLIMDEAFAQYDDTRTAEAFDYLRDISSDRQIIFFTCKSREVEIARDIFGDSLNIIELSLQGGK